MDNLNGALGFKATLDIDDFSASAEAMERQVRRISSTTQAESEDMENSLLQFAQRGASYITTILVGQGMSSLLQSMVQTRGQFQQLEIAFETMLGSGTKAKALMDQMVQTAAKTPFDLMGVAGGAKQLLAYGAAADKVNDTLVRLGNIASGLSIPLNDIVYLYGTTMVQGRLYTQDVRQFTGRGIPLVRELAEMYGVTADKISEMVTAGKIGFPDVEKVINKLTNAGGQFYNLMEKQSKSLTGMLSNLEDSWASMLNEIGEQNQDLFAGAIGFASNLVEHYDDIIRVLKAVAVGYGTVKAAIVLNTLATKGYTGVALVDNTVKAAKIALLKTDAALTGKVKAQTELMTAADKAHVAALEAELTAEEMVNLQKKLRISTIAGLLTAQQQEYLSNLGLTTSSQGYEAAALGVLSVEQQEALKKVDLTSKSAIYKAALEQEVVSKKMNRNATLDAMRADVSAAAAAVEAAKQRAIASTAAVEQARLDVYWARQSGNATAIAAAEKKLEAAVEQQGITRKAALTAQSEFYTKKKALETAATRQSTSASVADTTAKGAQTTATSILTTVTNKATLAVKTLWAAIKANPLGWVISIIGIVTSALMMFRKKTDETTTAQGEFQDSINKEIQNLDLLFAVLRNSDKSTKVYKDTLDKINAICKDYNSTLLKENASLAEQTTKYGELTQAIQANTAEKIKAKFIEQELQNLFDSSNSNYDTFNTRLGNLQYNTGKTRHVTDSKHGESYDTPIMEAAASIQNMGEPVKEAIRSFVEEGAKELSKLTGDEYAKRYQEVLASIVNSTQAATKASDAEMSSFQAQLEIYLNNQIKSQQIFSDKTEEINEQLSEFLSKTADKAEDTAGKVDYISMSFSDLSTEIQNTQKKIDELNKKEVKLPADTTELERLQKLLGELNGAVATKTSNLNTESGIAARIKELKDERANVEINSAQYKKLTKDIQALQAKLPSSGGSNSGANARQTATQKQLEAERAAEEARIAIMEEGYEKRSKLLELEHKRNLDKINKDEQELLAAKKKAGKGKSLTAEETAGFDARRQAENQSYEKQQQKLFDGEIDYKKQQYQLYFQWVRNVGKDVADKHFASLIKEGTSYTSWINSQIAALEKKKTENPDAFSEGDASYLNQLVGEKNAMSGAKTGMDTFKESVSNALAEASNLAEKLEAIAEMKDRLANGDFNLNADETTEAAYSLDEQDLELQKELQQTIVNDFKSFEAKKASLTKYYAALRLTEQAQSNAELLKRINEGEAEALSSLNAAQLQSSDEWKKLFENLDYMTASEIQQLLDTIKTQMANANLKLAPADYQALMESLNRAKARIVQLNPFKALSKSFADYISSLKELKKAQKDNLGTEEIAKYKQGVISSAQQAASAISMIGQVTGTIGGTIAGVAESFGADGKTSAIIEGVTGALGGATKAAGGVAKIMAGDLVGGITDVIAGLGDFIVSLNGVSDAMHEEEIKQLQSDIDALADSYAELGEQINRAYSTDKANLLKMQNENLMKQNEKIRQQIKEEEDKKKTDSEKIKEWQNQIAENEKEIAENSKYAIVEAIMGTDVASAIDEFATAYADAWTSGTNAAKKSSATVKNLIKTAIIEQLKNKLKPEVEEFMSYLAKALEDGVIDEAEDAMLQRYQERLDQESEDYLSKTGKYLKDDTEEDALTGAVRSMSEETGGIIAGRMNAAIINQSEQSSILRSSLAYQAQIAQNTSDTARTLREIQTDIQAIKNRENPYLSQGIS